MDYLFEWDLAKAWVNLKKHKVEFEEAMQVFADPHVIHLEDPKHSSDEDRFYAVGKTLIGRVITVRYTWRGHKIRILGASDWRKWRRYYEENTRPQ